MKICFLTYDIFTIGGIQRVVSVITNKLSNYYDIEILCMNEKCKINRDLYDLNNKVNVVINDGELSKSILNKILYKIIKYFNKKTGLLNNKRYVGILSSVYFTSNRKKKIIEYINSKNYDLVIGVSGEYSLLLGAISDKLKARTIGWQHNSYDAYLKNKGRYHWNEDELFNKYINKLDRYLVLSKYDHDMLLKKNDIKSIIMYNPRSFDSTEKSPLTSKQFLAAGRLNYQKGFDLLIKSFYKFSQTNKEWNLVIVGEGEEKSTIEKLINMYNLNERVFLKGFTDNIKQYFLNSSVLLLSSRWEGMPMIVLESLEMGVPVISYDITAVRSMLYNNKNSLIIDKFDVDEFAKAMNILSSNSKLRYSLGKNAIKESEKFSIDNIVEQWNKLLKNL